MCLPFNVQESNYFLITSTGQFCDESKAKEEVEDGQKLQWKKEIHNH
jgi:hypothetical protein